MPQRRILSVWLPRWPITRLRRGQDCAQSDNPLATVETVRGKRRLAAVCERSAALGLYPGQPLTAARAVCPHLGVSNADPEADRASLQGLASWCERYTPLVAADPPEGLWLDVSGCAHLFRDETGLAANLAQRLVRIPCRLAIAGTAGAAWALARWASCENAPAMIISGQEPTALRSLPVACLRLEQPTIAGLRRLRLKTVGDLLRLPRAELMVRFGASLLLRLDQALGIADEIVPWHHQAQAFESRLAFAEPIAAADDLRRALALLSEHLCRSLSEKQAGAHRFTCRFYRVDNAVARIDITTVLPVRDAKYLSKLLISKLERVDPGFGIEIAALAAQNVAPFLPTQRSLLGPRAEGSGKVASLVDALGNRLPPEQMWGVAPHESHVPERAVVRTPPLTARSAWLADPSRPRPVRLLRRPESIQVTAPVPDDAPLAFRWRGALHRVRAASGPERIAAEWWRRSASPPPHPGRPETDLMRDYYRVEDEAGSRFWVFRAGLCNGGQWFLHGVFG